MTDPTPLVEPGDAPAPTPLVEQRVRAGARASVETPAPERLRPAPAYGVFAPPGGRARVGFRAPAGVVDLAVLLGDASFDTGSLDRLLAAGPGRWAAVADAVAARLPDAAPEAVHPEAEVELLLPFTVADYTDFYCSEAHATNVSAVLRPGQPPLAPSWRHLPAGYTGRAGTVVVSGTPVLRPWGQLPPDVPGGSPRFGPTERLDLEAELGFVVGAASEPGVPVGVDAFAEHVFGVVVLDDWSARDVQAWETRPLGPHLGKSFATSISPWVVPLAALPRVPLAPQSPPPLPYLTATSPWTLDLELSVARDGEVVTRPPYASTYFSPAQMLAHLTSGGAPVRTGDLFASGTVSGSRRDQVGSLLELTRGGVEPVVVGGRERTWLVDGEEVTISATAPDPTDPHAPRLDLGSVTGRIGPAHPA